MEYIFYRIVKWNYDRDNMDFKLTREVQMLAEELIELCLYDRAEAKLIAKHIKDSYAPSIDDKNLSTKEKDAIVDALGDLIFIAVGAIAKLGFDPVMVMKRICDANDKKGFKKDSNGKIIKDNNFVEPIHIGE